MTAAGELAEPGPAERLSSHQGSFRTHRQYLSALTATIRQHYGGRFMLIAPDKVSAGLVGRFREAVPGLDLQRRQVDEAVLQRVLMSAWGTEFMLWSAGQMASDESESIALANQWGVVQAYYACAYAAQAAAVAKGNPRPDSHPKTQQLYVQLWIESHRTFPPWSLGVNHTGVVNLPAGIEVVDKLHAWSGVDGASCWSLNALLLRSTRRPMLEEREQRRRAELLAAKRRAFRADQEARRAAGRRLLGERDFPTPRLNEDQHREIDVALRATSLLDYLYRLRTRSHYDDPQVFFEGPQDSDDAAALHRDLRYLVSWTFLLHELLVVELVGKGVFEAAASRWLKNPVAASAGFGLRRRLDWLL